MFELLWANTDQVSAQPDLSAWNAIFSASPVVQIALLTLVLMSVISWTVIYTKFQQLRQCEQDDLPFLDFFWKANSLDDIFTSLDKYDTSPMANIFRSGYSELRKIADSNLADQSRSDTPLLSGSDNLERALTKALHNQVSSLEQRLNFLATTGTAAPFIGLFGTVWGIMNAFQKIGATGSANLAVVAPGISEALIATAVGLAAAIPASIAYNHFISKVKKQELQLENFASDFLNIAKRNFFKGN